MYLYELFGDVGLTPMKDPTKDNNDADGEAPQDGKLIDRLRQSMMDIITPLAANGVPFVTVNAVMDQLRRLRSGINVDRGLVMQVLDPESVKMVTKIEGDRIFFTLPGDDTRETDDDQKQKDAEQVSKIASQQAQKNITA